MLGQTHPIVLSQEVALRHAELHVEADRDRLEHIAIRGATPLEQWADVAATWAVVAALALLLAAGLATTEAPAHREELLFVPTAGQTVAPVPEAHFPIPGAARQINAAGL